MFRVHRDFKGLLKAAQDEYDSLVELNESLRKKVAEWNKDEEIRRQLSWLSIIAPTPYARCQITRRKQKERSETVTTSHVRMAASICTN